jgi:hypothetical protein
VVFKGLLLTFALTVMLQQQASSHEATGASPQALSLAGRVTNYWSFGGYADHLYVETWDNGDAIYYSFAIDAASETLAAERIPILPLCFLTESRAVLWDNVRNNFSPGPTTLWSEQSLNKVLFSPDIVLRPLFVLRHGFLLGHRSFPDGAFCLVRPNYSHGLLDLEFQWSTDLPSAGRILGVEVLSLSEECKTIHLVVHRVDVSTNKVSFELVAWDTNSGQFRSLHTWREFRPLLLSGDMLIGTNISTQLSPESKLKFTDAIEVRTITLPEIVLYKIPSLDSSDRILHVAKVDGCRFVSLNSSSIRLVNLMEGNMRKICVFTDADHKE